MVTINYSEKQGKHLKKIMRLYIYFDCEQCNNLTRIVFHLIVAYCRIST